MIDNISDKNQTTDPETKPNQPQKDRKNNGCLRLIEGGRSPGQVRPEKAPPSRREWHNLLKNLSGPTRRLFIYHTLKKSLAMSGVKNPSVRSAFALLRRWVSGLPLDKVAVKAAIARLEAVQANALAAVDAGYDDLYSPAPLDGIATTLCNLLKSLIVNPEPSEDMGYDTFVAAVFLASHRGEFWKCLTETAQVRLVYELSERPQLRLA